MASCVLTSANILMGENSGFLAQWVSGRGVGCFRQNFLGSDRPAGRFRGADVAVHRLPGDGSRSFGIGAAHFSKVTLFCGFPAKAVMLVARPSSHDVEKSAVFCCFSVSRRLTDSYQHRPPLCGSGGWARSRRSAQVEGGCPLSPTRADTMPVALAPDQDLKKAANTHPSILSSQSEGMRRAERQVSRPGSGVRTAAGRQNLAGKRRFSRVMVFEPNGVGVEVAGHEPSDVAVAEMLLGAVNRVN